MIRGLFFIVPVGNIPYDATEEQLVHICEEVGPVVNFRYVFCSFGFVLQDDLLLLSYQGYILSVSLSMASQNVLNVMVLDAEEVAAQMKHLIL